MTVTCADIGHDDTRVRNAGATWGLHPDGTWKNLHRWYTDHPTFAS